MIAQIDIAEGLLCDEKCHGSAYVRKVIDSLRVIIY